MTKQYFAVPPDSRPDSVIVVRDAGLVIAAPYLARLWFMLGLATDHSFVNRAATERAVRLLDFLVFGMNARREAESALGRVLCGLTPTEVLVEQSSISEREQQSIDGLLAAMIGHWKAIGSTSIEGLRTTFLEREGQLTKEELGWCLRIQPKAYDILLDRLPWGFANCRLPWMTDPLVVFWR